MATAYSSLIEEIVGLTRKIDALAENNDWLSMHDLVEQRMLQLNRVFDDLNRDKNRELDGADCEKLAQIASSNERILERAKARQSEIISFACTQRAGSAAQEAYTAHAR